MWAAASRLWGLRGKLRALLGDRHAALRLGGAQGLHGSPVPCGKNLLKKFASKTKKKFWYEGPSLGSHLAYKPSQLEFLTKSTSKKTKKEDHVRLRALNGLLYKALTDLLCTPEVSQEICDLNVELSKVSLTSDFSACRVYWKTTLSAEQNAHTEAALQRSAAHMRHLLMSQQTLRNVPPIVFVQDKENAALAEVDWLLAVADFGPPNEKDNFMHSDFRDPEAQNAPSLCDTPGPAMHSTVCGINHEALNKQIMEYKRRKERAHGSVSLEHVAELTKQMKKRKKTKPRIDEDLSPKNHLWGTAGEDDLGDSGACLEEHSLGHGWELPEAEQELQVERGGNRKE
ncbi:PREDICTED: putative ribosome-binding factor A, mitochondrial isoform X1 [Ceratotherium simum simum]|uniref:Ribosome-binding factor A, mitochondrial isoform X1 n=1 Tax=Ceratotherium simum simum TaxID=73337 RepID=A0ABM1CBS2_CERSS|nr:PREDICTED: putative ribosome-binding factor A, mitochondrial isoform X1 [Ceratotherium simum simum]